jgi:quercetin dioxygenase-like cupin family protein
LSRVTVMPDAELAAHHHPGTQVAFVEQGTLTYSVNSGSVTVMKGSSDDPEVVRRIEAGETGKIRSGQWIVEQPNDHHQAANRGEVPVVIFTATLLKKGFPAAIPD